MNSDEAYRNLANAVVLQAVEDYENAMEILSTDFSDIAKTDKEKEKVHTLVVRATHDRDSCLRFFTHEYFKLFTNIPAESILYFIDNGIANAQPVIKKGKQYKCTCGTVLSVKKNQKYSPITKCKKCKKYWRVRGEPIKEMEDEA